MLLQIRPHGGELSALQLAAAELSVHGGLARFGERIDRATLSFHAVNGPDEQRRIVCRVDVRMRPKRVRVECSDADVAVAVDTAVARVARSVALALDVEGGWSG